MKPANLTRPIVFVAVLALALPAGPLAARPVGDLAWMEGHWIAEPGDGSRSEELWTSPAAGLMLAVSRTVGADGKVAFEYLRIEESGDDLVYQASPGGAPPTPFRLAELDGRRAVFANPEHDFPQRIVYWRDGESLCARIEGEVGGESQSAEWCWKRAVGQR